MREFQEIGSNVGAGTHLASRKKRQGELRIIVAAPSHVPFPLSLMCWSHIGFFCVLLCRKKNILQPSDWWFVLAGLKNIHRNEQILLKYWDFSTFISFPAALQSSPALITPLTTSAALESCLRADRHKVAGWVSGDGRSRAVCLFAGAIIKVLPGLLLLHHHVWSPPRVLEVPLERVGQDLCHLCRSREEEVITQDCFLGGGKCINTSCLLQPRQRA